VVDSKSRLINKLKRLRLLWRVNSAARGFMGLISFTSLLLSMSFVFGLQGYARAAVALTAFATAVSFLLVGVLYPLFRSISLLDIALLVDKKNELLLGRVSSSIDLDMGESGHSAARKEFISRLNDETVSLLENLDAGKAVNFKTTLYCFVATVMLFGIITSALVFTGKTVHDAATYFSSPYLPEKEIVEIVYISGDMIIPSGGNAEIRVEFSKKLKGSPHIAILREGLEPELKDLRLEDRTRLEKTPYSCEIASVSGDMRYRVEYGDFESGIYSIVTVDPPGIKSMSVDLEYPEYTRLLPDRREGGGDIRVPFGTNAGFLIEATTNLSKAYLEFSDGNVLDLQVEGKLATGGVEVKEKQKYRVMLTDTNGFSNTMPPSYIMEAVPDAVPGIKIISPAADLSVPVNSVVEIQAEASDDYGITESWLEYRIENTGIAQTMAINISSGREIKINIPWKIYEGNIIEGDNIVYRVFVKDNDTLTGPKTAGSEERRLMVLSRFQDYMAIEQDQETLIENMEETLSDSELISEKFKELAQSMESKGVDKKQWSSETGRTLERQAQLENELRELSDSLRNSIERMKNNELVNMDTLKKMQELNRLMDDIMTDEVKNLMEQIRNRLENMDLNGLDKKLLEAQINQEKILKSLEQNINRLKQIKMEQSIASLRDHMKQLAQRQERLLDHTEKLAEAAGQKPLEGNMKHEANRQSREELRISEETAVEIAMMKDIAGGIQQISPVTSEKLKEYAELAKQTGLVDNLESARKNLGEYRLDPAMRNEKQSLSTMNKISSGLENMHRGFHGEMT